MPPPLALPPDPAGVASDADLLLALQNFAETANRNWNHGGHNVADPFAPDQGWWQYDDQTYEPWLFDRAQAWRMLASMTQLSRLQSQAKSDLNYYENRLGEDGIFMNKTGEADTKYSYVHAWSASQAKRQSAYQATLNGWADLPHLNDASLWTEREVWVALYAAIEMQKASDVSTVGRGQAMLDHWDLVCNGRPAPLVTYTKHEGGGPGGTTPTDLVSSPWMSALYFQVAREYVQLNPATAPQVFRQASQYFDWLTAPETRGFYPGSDAHPECGGLVFPAYLAGGRLSVMPDLMKETQTMHWTWQGSACSLPERKQRLAWTTPLQ